MMATRKGNASANIINGTNGADDIYGYGGNDTLRGLAGDDLVAGGTGHDRIFGDAGNDTLHGEDGNDVMKGWAGNDFMIGGAGADILWGEQGDDTLRGWTGNDRLGAGQGSNRLYGEQGDDVMLWNPGPGNVGEELAGITNRFNGGEGFDAIEVTSETTVTLYFDNPDGSETPREIRSVITLMMDDYAEDSDLASIHIGGNELDDDPYITGYVQSVERFEFTGGQVTFFGARQDVTVVGSRFNDIFLGADGDEVFEGGGGNDQFSPGAGNNVVRSWTADEDTFSFRAYEAGSTLVEGFNGEGSAGGDRLGIFNPLGADVNVTARADGTTLFDWGIGHAVVDATGLVAGQDYFLT
jgi:Ca2+-binding RTX toxin-like protein